MTDELLFDRRLRDYLEDVRLWHGYVRFLGLPTLQDRPDTPLADLFVPPALAEQRVAPEADPAFWPAGTDVLSALAERPRLVVLGDPGSGKSTIVNWLAWLMASGDSAGVPAAIAGRLPIPLIARELRLGQVGGFDDLLHEFLARPVAESFGGAPDVLNDYLARDRAVLLVDGLDEVPLEQRRALRDALREAWARHPGLLTVATSRIVGYDECPLDPAAPPPPSHADADVAAVLAKADAYAMRRIATLSTEIFFNGAESRTPVRYVMPFDDGRIHAFANRWYQLRSIRQVAEVDSAAFTRALLREPGVAQLARTPQLLTLMALVYRVRAQLPDGRALLYDMITEAYLESIDQSRALAADPFPWREKRRWLARVGFEMQWMRSELGPADDPAGGRELLVSKDQVLTWLDEAIAQSGYSTNSAAASTGADAQASFATAYLDWVARRSGLLLPRGEELFAFVHLSFQEYFAALYLQQHIGDADWVIAQRDGEAFDDGDRRVTAEALRRWAGDRRWQETLVFTQEGFAHSPRDARRLAGWFFGKDHAAFDGPWPEVQPEADRYPSPPAELEDAHARIELLARAVVNPHSGWIAGDRAQAIEVAVRFFEEAERRFMPGGFLVYPRSAALKRLLDSEAARGAVWDALAARRRPALDLQGGGTIDAGSLASMDWLHAVFVDSLSNADLSALSGLRELEILWVGGAPRLTSIDALAALGKLRVLELWNAPIADLGPLSGLSELYGLYMLTTEPVDLQPLGALAGLENLSLHCSRIRSAAPLASCSRLSWLDVSSSVLPDIDALESLPQLATLRIAVDQPLSAGLAVKQADGRLEVFRAGERLPASGIG